MKNKKAFTLIELLVVIAIIGIIATLAIVALQQARQNARDAKRVADVKQMSTALEMYFNEHQSYPDSLDDLKEAGYMQIIPKAPTPADKGCEDSNDYNYSASSNKDHYQITFCTGKQVADLGPGNLCMTPGGLSTDCSTIASVPDPDPFCDPNEPVVFVDEDGNGYYDIHTCCELSAIRSNPSANYELVNNLDCSNTENWSQDIDGTTYEGFPTIDFAGNLEGNNYAIDNIHLYEGHGGMAGIFSNLQAASVSVSNLKIVNVTLDNRGGGVAGVLFSKSNGPTFLNNVTILGGSISHSSGGYAGGFIGRIEGSLSMSSSSISGLSVNLDHKQAVFGGLVGYISDSFSNNIISNSNFANSEIIFTNSLIMSGIVVNASNLLIENSHVSRISFDGTKGSVAGIIGNADDTDIVNSYVADSTINSSGGYISGLVQSIHGGRIDNSHVINTNITSDIYGTISGFIYSSGTATINNSSFRGGAISAIDCQEVSGFGQYLSDNSIISNSFFEGDVLVSYAEGFPYWKGVTGFFTNVDDSSTVANSYFSGKITGDAVYKSCFVRGPYGTTSQSYYNSDKCTLGDSSGAIGLSDAEMKDPSSYSGWNINTPSCSGADDNNPWRWTSGNYPCLYSDLTCSCS